MMVESTLSLEERVNIAYRRLTLIVAATTRDPHDYGINTGDLLSAIQKAAEEAAMAIGPLRHAPGEIGEWAPPPEAQP